MSRRSPADMVEMPRWQLYAILAVQTLGFIVIGSVIWDWTGRDLGALLIIGASDAAAGLAVGAALTTCLWALLRFAPGFADRLVHMQAETYAFLGKPLPLAGVLFISLCAGVGEETFVRAGLQTVLGDALGPLAGALLATVVFAALHMAKPLIAAIVFAIGLVFAGVYAATGSLAAVAIGHAIYDVFALIWLQQRMQALGLPAPRPDEDDPA